MYNFITLGSDCSPATALRNLNLRICALPFDWIVSTVQSLEKCFEDNFGKFHENLYFNDTRKRLIDDYGFQYPHDYPLINSITNEEIGEGVIAEENDKYIIDDWKKYHEVVKEKYQRRINRFLDIMKDSKPIIILCRYSKEDVYNLKKIIERIFRRNDIIFLNSCQEEFTTDKIISLYTEKNGIWNDTEIWRKMLDKILKN